MKINKLFMYKNYKIHNNMLIVIQIILVALFSIENMVLINVCNTFAF